MKMQTESSICVGDRVHVGVPYSDEYDQGTVVERKGNCLLVYWARCGEEYWEAEDELSLGHPGCWPDEPVAERLS